MPDQTGKRLATKKLVQETSYLGILHFNISMYTDKSIMHSSGKWQN